MADRLGAVMKVEPPCVTRKATAYNCKRCGRPYMKTHGQRRYCRGCAKEVENDYSRQWHKKYPLGSKAHRIVKGAVVTGELPPPTDFECADCGAPADRYDHRDYRRPLDVDPVCITCNKLRGRAAPYLNEGQGA